MLSHFAVRKACFFARGAFLFLVVFSSFLLMFLVCGGEAILRIACLARASLVGMLSCSANNLLISFPFFHPTLAYISAALCIPFVQLCGFCVCNSLCFSLVVASFVLVCSLSASILCVYSSLLLSGVGDVLSPVFLAKSLLWVACI